MRAEKRVNLSGMLQTVLVTALLLACALVTDVRAGSDLYATDPPALTPVQCGQCHSKHYGDLRQSGGKHQFPCQDCHLTFHAYNPVKGNYAELMPKCAQCHAMPHGEKQVNCQNCHAPHAAALPVTLARVKDVCGDCHGDETRQLKENPSRHSQQQCIACHQEKHGVIPSCFACHKPHVADQSNAECLTCHPAHQPLKIEFRAETRTELCRDCHDDVYGKWAKTASKHGKVGCVSCHGQHRQVPQCLNCHPQPHPKSQLAMFPRCLDCHLDVHDLPVKKK